MTQIAFSHCGGYLSGFVMQGHTSDNASEKGRLVCAALSSAAYMCANTLTEVIGLKCDTEVRDGYMRIEVAGDLCPAQQCLKGLRLHFGELKTQYPQHITLIDE